MCQVGYDENKLPKITMDEALTYLNEVVQKLYEQYGKYPVGDQIRYEVYIGSHDENDLSTDAYDYRIKALEQLKNEGVVLDYVLENRSEEVQKSQYFSDVYEFKVAKCLVDKEKLKEHVRILNQPRIYYDKETARGEVNGVSFRIKKGSPDDKVFVYLCENIGKAMPRMDILRVAKFYETHERPDKTRRNSETYLINELAKALRKKTGLTTNSLVNNNGELTLKGILLDLPQATPNKT